MYQYEHPHPAVTTDAVVFTIIDGTLNVLLIERAHEPFKGMWAFPGGFVDIDEDLDDCVHRELAEETGLAGIDLQQFRTFGTPGRDPRERVITVAYMALVRSEGLRPQAADDAAAVAWHDVDGLSGLATDHDQMLAHARAHLVEKLETSDIALGMMSDEFKLPELQRVYEVIFGDTLDPEPFRDWVLSKGWIEQT